jgi:hypothetical protein
MAISVAVKHARQADTRGRVAPLADGAWIRVLAVAVRGTNLARLTSGLEVARLSCATPGWHGCVDAPSGDAGVIGAVNLIVAVRCSRTSGCAAAAGSTRASCLPAAPTTPAQNKYKKDGETDSMSPETHWANPLVSIIVVDSRNKRHFAFTKLHPQDIW